VTKLRVLALSTLFPSPQRPTFGQFVESSLRAVAQRGDVDLTVINPLGIPPWPLSLRQPYAALACNPAQSSFEGVAVHHPRFTLIPKFGGDSNPALIVRAIRPLVQRLHAERPFDLIDAQFFFPDGPAAAILADELGLPCSIKARGGDILYWGARPKALAQIRMAAAKSAGMLAVSAAMARDMTELGIDHDKITVHYTGLDHARFHTRPRAEARSVIAGSLGVPEDGALLVAAGALIDVKGQRHAIDALTALPGTRLALAGKGEDERKLRAQAQELGLGERVHFLGQISHEQLPMLFAAADTAVLPSSREGIANAWIEALGCGTPLVIPAVGGALEVLTNPSAGRIAERSGAAIASAVQDLLAHPIPQAEVAANAAHFTWERNAEELAGYWSRLGKT
jgi:glycosyltransferase involved in cell wall biosynthesis